ncbi:MAG TPA: hypothetical protein VMT34_11255 [Aggregatilineales bacterium]|nr:hypothetical protein [Aggregatilineales bacterium]
MFSTRCTSCQQLINLKTEEVRQAVEETEAKHEKFYGMPCPKCKKLVKISVKELKRKLPLVPPAGETASSS